MMEVKTCRLLLLPSDLLYLSPMVPPFGYGALLIVVSGSVSIIGIGIDIVIVGMLACPNMVYLDFRLLWCVAAAAVNKHKLREAGF
jgi:hypothetical protein